MSGIRFTMKILAMLGVAPLSTTLAFAEDDPNAAITAETARINAETARINAQAALTTAKAAKDKGAVEALGLPEIENKTTLENNGGAIETSMLASYTVSAAAVEFAKMSKKKQVINATRCRKKSLFCLAMPLLT